MINHIIRLSNYFSLSIFQELCYPDSYTTMLDEQHRSELSHFRSESKKGKKGSRTQSRLHLRL